MRVFAHATRITLRTTHHDYESRITQPARIAPLPRGLVQRRHILRREGERLIGRQDQAALLAQRPIAGRAAWRTCSGPPQHEITGHAAVERDPPAEVLPEGGQVTGSLCRLNAVTPASIRSGMNASARPQVWKKTGTPASRYTAMTRAMAGTTAARARGLISGPPSRRSRRPASPPRRPQPDSPGRSRHGNPRCVQHGRGGLRLGNQRNQRFLHAQQQDEAIQQAGAVLADQERLRRVLAVE